MYQGGFFDELIIDNFAGGGGASVGIELAMVGTSPILLSMTIRRNL